MHNENKLLWVTTLLRPVKNAVAYNYICLSKFYFYIENRIDDLLCGFVLESSEMLKILQKAQLFANYILE